jgi:hypothetical protein
VSILLISPEVVQHLPYWRHLLLESPIYQDRVCLWAIDEAYVLIQWYVFSVIPKHSLKCKLFSKIQLFHIVIVVQTVLIMLKYNPDCIVQAMTIRWTLLYRFHLNYVIGASSSDLPTRD